MSILFLSHCLPYPPTKGDKVRAYHSLRRLSRDHEVSLLALTREGYDFDEVPVLRDLCSRVEVSHLDRREAMIRTALRAWEPKPLTLSYYRSTAFAERVLELHRRHDFDAVIAYCSSMAPYAELLEGVPKLIDLVDVDSGKWELFAQTGSFPRSLVYSLEARRLRRYEAEIVGRFDRVFVSTSKELELLESFAPSARASVLMNGVDLESFRPSSLPKSGPPALVFTGQMDYYPNVEGVTHFSRRIFPRLRQRFPELEFVIVGRSPTAAVRRLEAIPGVYVTGSVVDVRPFLARAWAFVAPLHIARGVQNKVLEAMAMGLPVVCTDTVMAGLADGGLQPGCDLLVGEDDKKFESRLVELLDNSQYRATVGRAGLEAVSRGYRWERNLDVLTAALDELGVEASPRTAQAVAEPTAIDSWETAESASDTGARRRAADALGRGLILLEDHADGS